MKTKIQNIRLQYTENREITEIVLTTNQSVNIDDLKEIVAKGKELVCEVKTFRKKRSLDANSYLWVLLNKQAAVLNTNKDELYIQALSNYGVFTHIVVKANVVDRVISEWKTVRELGNVTINGQDGIQLQCFFGSHDYNSKEFSTLLDGVVNDCKDLGIETISSNELERMKSAWGR